MRHTSSAGSTPTVWHPRRSRSTTRLPTPGEPPAPSQSLYITPERRLSTEGYSSSAGTSGGWFPRGGSWGSTRRLTEGVPGRGCAQKGVLLWGRASTEGDFREGGGGEAALS